MRCFRRLDETRRSLLWRRLEPIPLSLHVGQLRSYAPRRRDPGWFAPWNQLASVLPTKSWMAPPFGAKPGTSTRPPVQPPQSRHSGSLLQQRANCRLGALIEESRPAGRARPGHQPCQLAKRCSGTHRPPLVRDRITRREVQQPRNMRPQQPLGHTGSCQDGGSIYNLHASHSSLPYTRIAAVSLEIAGSSRGTTNEKASRGYGTETNSPFGHSARDGNGVN